MKREVLKIAIDGARQIFTPYQVNGHLRGTHRLIVIFAWHLNLSQQHWGWREAENPESLLYKGFNNHPNHLFSCYMVGKGK
jgi:hypothetical protein